MPLNCFVLKIQLRITRTKPVYSVYRQPHIAISMEWIYCRCCVFHIYMPYAQYTHYDVALCCERLCFIFRSAATSSGNKIRLKSSNAT